MTGEDAVVALTYECNDDHVHRNVEVAVGVRRLDQTPLFYLGTKVVKQDVASVSGSGQFVCRIDRLPLEPGHYTVNVEIKCSGVIVDHVESAAEVHVAEGDYYGTGVLWPYGGVLCDYAWSHRANPDSQEEKGVVNASS
jgi:hypothetical protein